MQDPQLAHREAFGTVRDAGGTFRALNPPFRFSGTRAGVQPFAARLGEHTDDVLGQIGYTPGEIEEFRASGILG